MLTVFVRGPPLAMLTGRVSDVQTDNWLDPNYKGPGGGAAPQKKGWNPFAR